MNRVPTKNIDRIFNVLFFGDRNIWPQQPGNIFTEEIILFLWRNWQAEGNFFSWNWIIPVFLITYELLKVAKLNFTKIFLLPVKLSKEIVLFLLWIYYCLAGEANHTYVLMSGNILSNCFSAENLSKSRSYMTDGVNMQIFVYAEKI